MPPKQKPRISRRKPGWRRYKKMFVLSVEGAVTEKQYFDWLEDAGSLVKVNCLNKKKGSAPQMILDEMNKHIKKEGLGKEDEAWLVTDKDQWNDSQLNELYEWTKKNSNYNFALSNPKFEYWLLLHFEDGSGVSSARECSEKLKRYLPDYNKRINVNLFSEEMIKDAISRAKQKDSPQSIDWPRRTGTTVYRLVERIIKSKDLLDR